MKSTRCFTTVGGESCSPSSVGLDLLGEGLSFLRLLKTFFLGGGPKSTFFSSLFAYFSAKTLRMISQFTVAWPLLRWNSQYVFGSLVHFFVWIAFVSDVEIETRKGVLLPSHRSGVLGIDLSRVISAVYRLYPSVRGWFLFDRMLFGQRDEFLFGSSIVCDPMDDIL